ncbi:MAG: DUF924 domain-containing protein [Rhodocyclaceae bacterium]|nr:MAG: DUF924 domain-containing protein [Rhodocyclaceae bacterium]
MTTPQAILDFWFLPVDHPGHGKPRPEWFRKDDAFDDLIRQRFGAAIESALAGGFQDWRAKASGALAYILVLDQFTRNAFRDSAKAFSGDGLALAAAANVVAQEWDKTLPVVQRWFVYMPFEHAESVAEQERSVALFSALAAEVEGYGDVLDYAQRHRDIVRRFGRFPHRNRLLGRASTTEEIEFLKLPGSSF